MQAVLTVCRFTLFIVRLIVWTVLLPFIIIITCVRMVVNRLKFRHQLIKSGISKQWADKLSRRYSIRIKDISDIIKLSKNRKLHQIN